MIVLQLQDKVIGFTHFDLSVDLQDINEHSNHGSPSDSELPGVSLTSKDSIESSSESSVEESVSSCQIRSTVSSEQVVYPLQDSSSGVKAFEAASISGQSNEPPISEEGREVLFTKSARYVESADFPIKLTNSEYLQSVEDTLESIVVHTEDPLPDAAINIHEATSAPNLSSSLPINESGCNKDRKQVDERANRRKTLSFHTKNVNLDIRDISGMFQGKLNFTVRFFS
jgi:hypothetical protein